VSKANAAEASRGCKLSRSAGRKLAHLHHFEPTLAEESPQTGKSRGVMCAISGYFGMVRTLYPRGYHFKSTFFTSKWRRCFFCGFGTASTTPETPISRGLAPDRARAKIMKSNDIQSCPVLGKGFPFARWGKGRNKGRIRQVFRSDGNKGQ